MKGTLFVVATPIGNLGDISTRGLETLRNADLIACEDTRQSLKLLSHFGIQRPLTSYHDFNEREKAVELADRIEAGENIALVSDAGTPAVSDPGYRLVRLCRERGLHVVSIPGANAAVTALSASGLPSDQFLFVGFLPPRKSARREQLQSLRTFTGTLIFYEGPHRIHDTLEDMHEVFGDREACVGRELTKLHEEYVFGKLSDVRSRIKELGEFVVVVGGSPGADEAPPQELTREGVLKTLGLSRNQLYNLFFKK
ncbi:MAG TPA: 16S rRNA (cytidine(1402)-2'-O)-methyltransferase [Terriglobia bacterium]|nr:16S rRNA (cytidine(1402)-2'-O)-methyltransferase [Terriglobia bacterium]